MKDPAAAFFFQKERLENQFHWIMYRQKIFIYLNICFAWHTLSTPLNKKKRWEFLSVPYWLKEYTGCPTKHDNSKTTWKSSLVFEFICDIQSSIYFNMYDSWNNYHIIVLAMPFPKSGLRFLCFQYYRRYKEFGSDFNFVK